MRNRGSVNRRTGKTTPRAKNKTHWGAKGSKGSTTSQKAGKSGASGSKKAST
jgi:hypothetical protein